MIVVDEYLAVRVLSGDRPGELPDDDVVLPTSRHWRLLQHVRKPVGRPTVPAARQPARR